MSFAIQRFIRSESAGGFALVGATVLALLAANGPWAVGYRALLAWPIGVDIAGYGFSRPMLFWVNDALMAVMSTPAASVMLPPPSAPIPWKKVL